MNLLLSFCESDPIRLTNNIRSIIFAISNSTNPYMAAIATDTGLPQQTVQCVVDQLKQKNYVVFRLMGRKKIISLTPAGCNLVSSVRHYENGKVL